MAETQKQRQQAFYRSLAPVILRGFKEGKVASYGEPVPTLGMIEGLIDGVFADGKFRDGTVDNLGDLAVQVALNLPVTRAGLLNDVSWPFG